MKASDRTTYPATGMGRMAVRPVAYAVGACQHENSKRTKLRVIGKGTRCAGFAEADIMPQSTDSEDEGLGLLG